MRYYRLLLLVTALVMLSTVAQAAMIAPLSKFPNITQTDLVQYAPFKMFQGWENNQLTWYIATDSSNQQIACETEQNGVAELWGINFAPGLANLAGQVATVYVIVNGPSNQGPVFTAVPGDAIYSGAWQVTFVTYKPGAFKHAVKNADPYDPMTNPTGLPSATDATFSSLINGMPIVVKYPIVAVGPLGGPWTPAIPGEYRIPQGKVQTNYTYTKTIFLPFWQVYCRNSVTKKVTVQFFIVPDAFDPPGLPVADQLVPKLGANNSPGLALISQVFTQPFYFQIGPQPLTQYPVIHACPEFEYSPCQNTNYDYVPVERVVVLQRNVPPLNPASIFNNEPTIIQQFLFGNLAFVRDTQVINASAIERAKS